VLDQLIGLVYHLTMATVNVYDAKTHFSSLLARAESGERIVIARAGRPVAILAPLEDLSTPRPRGLGQGKVVVHANFDEPLPEFEEDAE
jgi:prevent-host-death family protein